MFLSMSNQADEAHEGDLVRPEPHTRQFDPDHFDQPEQPMRFRFTFISRKHLDEVHEGVIGSQIIGDVNMIYMLTKDGQITEGVPLNGRRVLIEPQPW